MLTRFKQCCLENTLIAFGAAILFAMSSIDIASNPIIIVGYFVVYLELSKLLFIALTGASAPIMLRYVMASIAVGSAIKCYEAIIQHDAKWALIMACSTAVFLLLRWLAIISTAERR